MMMWSSLRRSRASHVLAGAALGAVAALAIVAVVGAGPGEQREGVKLVGQYRIEVFDADGSLFAVREGSNALTPGGKALIAGCLSGLTTSSCFTSPPAGATATIIVGDHTSPCGAANSGVRILAFQNATNTAVSDGVWRASAAFSFSSSATITEAAATVGGFSGSPGFFYSGFNCLVVTPSIAVAAGDSAVVTITFTVN